jgi:hypothetical protein
MTAPQLAPGTVVAQKYRLGACLGYSGSSATYQATSAEGRDVVLKIFDPAIRQRADIMAAIEQTYAATNALPHDVVVPLLDAGYDAATGAPFSVSERIPFPSLAQIAAQRPLSPDEVTNVLAVIAQLLDRAHARQLFHHALKPTNIFVGFAQGYGVRVTDFGAGLSRTAVPTQEGYALAAPWLAPEQVQAAAPAGAGADVFAAALIAFYALTGRPYWRSCQGELNLAGWQQEVLGARVPASARARELGALLNNSFDTALAAGLAVDPAQRYRTVGELAAAIDGVVSARAPESQATMAFPTGAPSGPGTYPPAPGAPGIAPASGPPPGMGSLRQATYEGLGVASPGAQASPYPQAAPYPASPGPYPGSQAMPPAAMPQPSMPQIAAPAVDPGGYPGPYVSNQAPPAGAQANLGETAAGRPIDPAIHQRRKSTSKLVPILVALTAVVLLGGGVVAFFVLGKKPPIDPRPAASASALPSASAPAPEPTASASAVPSAEPSAVPSAEPSAAPTAEPAPGAEVTLACDPECDEIKVDDKPIELGKPLTLTPGKHQVTGKKEGFLSVKETITVKDGSPLEKTFKLKEKPVAGPVVAPRPAPPSPAASSSSAANRGPRRLSAARRPLRSRPRIQTAQPSRSARSERDSMGEDARAVDLARALGPAPGELGEGLLAPPGPRREPPQAERCGAPAGRAEGALRVAQHARERARLEHQAAGGHRHGLPIARVLAVRDVRRERRRPGPAAR